MMSFQDLYTRATTLISDSDSSTETLMKATINEGYHEVLSEWDWWFTYKTYADMTTTASQQAYRLPFDIDKLKSMTITVSSVEYPVMEVSDEDFWNKLNARDGDAESDVPQFFFQRRDEVEIYPIPSSSGNTITFYYKRIDKDLSQDDYTAGTVSDLADGARAVTGNGTTWTDAFVGRYLKIDSNGYWYEIYSRSSDTSITLRKDYKGTTISDGAESYTIGDMPLLPEGYHDMLVWYAVAFHYRQRKELDMAVAYENRYQAKLRKMIEVHGSDTTSAVMKGMDKVKQDVLIRDPNAYPLGLTS